MTYAETHHQYATDCQATTIIMSVIHPENVGRIILRLDLKKTRIVGTERGLYEILCRLLFVAKVVQIDGSESSNTRN